MKGLHKLREELHNKILKARNIEAVVLSTKFSRLWEFSTEDQKQEALNHIENLDKKKLVDWIKSHPEIDIGEKSLKEIYPVARKLGIKNYSRLQRDDLIVAIKEAERAMQQRRNVRGNVDPITGNENRI